MFALINTWFFKNKGKWKKRKDDYDVYNDDDSIDSYEADGVPDAAKNDVEKQDESAIEDEFGAKDYRSQMILKPDCTSRPLWVVRLETLDKYDAKVKCDLQIKWIKYACIFQIGTKRTYLSGIVFSCVQACSWFFNSYIGTCVQARTYSWSIIKYKIDRKT